MAGVSEPGSLPRKGGRHGSSESLLQSLASRLHRLRLSLTAPESSRLEAIRTEMLQALADGGEMRHPQLVDKIRFATDFDTLWYLRAELLAAVTDDIGADPAAERLERISTQFVGLLPVAARSRPRRPR